MSTSGYDRLIRGATVVDPAQKMRGRRDPASRVERVITLAGGVPAGLTEELFRCQVSYPGR